MSSFGEVYVEVDASVLNPGISPMAMISGADGPVEGANSLQVVLLWKYDEDTGDGGFTGWNWYFDDANGVFAKSLIDDECTFKNYLVDEGEGLLAELLANWDSADKAAFLNLRWNELYAQGCVYFVG